jgi:hypothetical protein
MQPGDYTRYTSRSADERRRRRQRRARRRLLLLVLVVVVVATAAAAAAVLRGRDEDAAATTGKDGGQAAAQGSPAATPRPTTPPPKVWVASRSDPVKVWIGGDSMGGELGWALAPMLKPSKAFKPTTFYKESSGICRYDFFDWQDEIEAVSRKSRPHAAVIMIGTNDTQSVWKSGKWIAYGDTAWKKAYEQRVGDIIDTLLAGGARRVYWVGMPIMGEGWRNSRMRLINRIFQKQAEKRPGAEYIDIWDLYATPDGEFDASLRLGDGVHFTAGGQQLLAKKVFRAIKADWLPPGSEAQEASPAASPSASASPL